SRGETPAIAAIGVAAASSATAARILSGKNICGTSVPQTSAAAHRRLGRAANLSGEETPGPVVSSVTDLPTRFGTESRFGLTHLGWSPVLPFRSCVAKTTRMPSRLLHKV